MDRVGTRCYMVTLANASPPHGIGAVERYDGSGGCLPPWPDGILSVLWGVELCVFFDPSGER